MTVHDDAWQSFSDRVAYEGPLRVAVHRREHAAGIDDHAREVNARILECVSPLRERHGVAGAEDNSPLAQELARMDARLDVLMELIGRAVLPDARLPASVPTRFNAIGLSGDAVPDLPAGDPVRVDIHMDACRALPLVLVGDVRAAPVGHFVVFRDIDPTTRDAIERMVFQHHRQRVARARQT